MKRILILMLALILCLIPCSLAEETAEDAAEVEETALTEESEEASEEPADAAETEEADASAEEEHPYPVATITMADGGVITLDLYPEVAPNTVANFITLANDGFYDGLIFHRVISGFMIQGGDPTGTGSGGPGYSIKGEFDQNGFRNVLSHTRGVISMARTLMPDSAGSQFFIMHEDGPFLDGAYAAFGRVTEGMDVVDAIAATETDSSDRPVEDQQIATIRVETYGVEYVVEKNQ